MSLNGSRPLTDVTGATLCLYPHRQAQPRTRWLDEFMIDLTSHAAALADHARTMMAGRLSQSLLLEAHPP